MASAAEELQAMVDETQALQLVPGDAVESQPKIDIDIPHASEMQAGETLAKVILVMLVDERFDSAISELKYYQKEKNKTPNFQTRTYGYFNHVIDMVERLKDLATIPNFEALRTSKQKEVREQMSALAREIKELLNRIEKVDYDLRVQDVRSTVWVIRTFSFCVVTLAFITALAEAIQQLSSPFSTVTKQIIAMLFYNI